MWKAAVRGTVIIFPNYMPYSVNCSINIVLCFLCFQTGLSISMVSQSFSEQAQWDKECESCGEGSEGENTANRAVKDKRKYGWVLFILLL